MIAKNNFESALKVLQSFSNEENYKKIEEAAQVIITSIKNKGKVISCGNGGSMCDAMHFAEEMTGRFRKNRPPLAAVSISDPSHITCVANDYGYQYIFSRFVESVGVEGDVLLAISTSGNSDNIINAVKSAKERGIKSIALTGKDGGKLASIADLEIRVPHLEWADRIQEVHIKIIHTLIQIVEQEIYPEYCK
jgi:D-sedoheptulose 7-phosphate isomerase